VSKPRGGTSGKPDPEPVAAAPAAHAPGVLGTHHGAYVFGFLVGAGALTAFFLGRLLLSVSSVLVLVVVSLFLAVGLNPAVEFFIRRGLKRPWAVLVVTICVILALVLFLVALVPVISDQVAAIVDSAPTWLQELRSNRRVQDMEDRWGVIDRVEEFVSDGKFAGAVFGGVVGVGLAIVSALTNTFIIVVLTLYFLSSLASFKEAMWNLVPASRRPRVSELGEQIFDNVGHYVSGAFIVAVCAGVSSLVFLLIVGLGDYAVALAAVVAILDVIPMIGATLGAVVVSAIGFATDVKIGLACVIFYIAYQQVENYIVYPRVMQRSFDLPGSAIVIAALIGAALLGVVGALLAIPTAAAIALVIREVWHPHQERR
jgi:predicted PurR-regulated permease PerM